VTGLAGRRVLVTGADGFIGSHLVERLLDHGADVRAFCLYNSNGSLGWLDELGPDRVRDLDVRLGDIRDERFVRDAADDVEFVFHLAALIAIPYSYEAPSSFVETNVRGTLNVLEAARATGVARMVNTSTSEVYGTPETVPIVESHPVRGQSPYSATKIAADKLCEAFALSFDTPVVTLRPFNTYGPRQSARAVIPTILGQLLAGVTEVRVGMLTPKRDFTYVTDTADGFVQAALADLVPGETVQLGTGDTISIGSLFELCCKVVGVEAAAVTEGERVRPERSEVMVLQSDPTRAAEVLGWAPTVALEDGLARTARWLERRVDAEKAQRYHR
jgi:NAD dependent epimerase/dehydratase